jgi:uncharacterized protein
MQTIAPAGEADVEERLLPGRHGWWYVGLGGVAKLASGHLDADGGLTPAARDFLAAAGLSRARRPSRSYALTVLTSTDCNLGCGYCFQNTALDPAGGNRPPRIAHARLTTDTVDAILRFTRLRMAEAGLEEFSVTLFGGEPLLNPLGCRELLVRAADAGMTTASMVSNGTLMTPRIAQQLSDAGLAWVQTTFDGDREEHDLIRAKRSGGGTFDTIVRNMTRVSEATPLRWILRVNVSQHSYAHLDALVDRLATALDPARCVLYFARIGDLGFGYANTLEHTEDLARLFAGWYERAVARGFHVPTPKASATCATCSYRDGRYGAVVNADGSLSSCWETAGRPEWLVGSVADGYLPPTVTESRWATCASLHQYTDDEASRTLFDDTLDGAVLDVLRAAGRI